MGGGRGVAGGPGPGKPCPPAGRESKYADLALFYYIKHSVPTMRFAAHGAGDFAGCWMHYYDKPINLPDAAGQGAASSRAALVAGDVECAEAMADTLRQVMNTLKTADGSQKASACAASSSSRPSDGRTARRASSRAATNPSCGCADCAIGCSRSFSRVSRVVVQARTCTTWVSTPTSQFTGAGSFR